MIIREIKFRALYKNKWVYFTIDDLININHESMTDEDYAILNHDPNTRCQYTGNKDKNGKEVYEDDMVKNNCCIGYVWFFTGSWRIYSKTYGDIEFDGQWEIIGNKYENKDLLK